MEYIYILYVLFILFFVVAIFVVVGHLVWLMVAAVVKWVFGLEKPAETFIPRSTLSGPPPPPPSPRSADDLTVFERQLVRFYRDGKISDDIYETLMARIRAERAERAPGPADVPRPRDVPTPV